jgi:hypothetical protein
VKKKDNKDEPAFPIAFQVMNEMGAWESVAFGGLTKREHVLLQLTSAYVERHGHTPLGHDYLRFKEAMDRILKEPVNDESE